MSSSDDSCSMSCPRACAKSGTTAFSLPATSRRSSPALKNCYSPEIPLLVRPTETTTRRRTGYNGSRTSPASTSPYARFAATATCAVSNCLPPGSLSSSTRRNWLLHKVYMSLHRMTLRSLQSPPSTGIHPCAPDSQYATTAAHIGTCLRLPRLQSPAFVNPAVHYLTPARTTTGSY